MTKIPRRKSRQEAVIMLYQSDLLEKDIGAIIKNEKIFDKKIDDFTEILVIGVYENKKAIDDKIISVVENWSFDRIAIIDRNILRVAVYEMLYLDEIPLKVSVDEAIEISKIMGQKDETPKFVNGVLGRILSQIENKSGN